MKYRVKSKSRGGFTLVELLVVLVILAILAAAIIPSMMGFIDKARDSNHIAECRQCVLATQAISNEYYGKEYSAPTLSDKDAILTLADVSGDIVRLTLTDYTVTRLIYHATDDTYVTYENGSYTIGGKPSSMADPDVRTSVFDAFTPYKTFFLDSAAVGIDGSRAAAVVEALKADGIDMTDMEAVSWQYNPSSSGAFYWTDVDISTLPVGTTLPVLKYSYSSGGYGVWIATVEEKTRDGATAKYNALGSYTGYTPSGGLVSYPYTYEHMMELYADALANYKAS